MTSPPPPPQLVAAARHLTAGGHTLPRLQCSRSGHGQKKAACAVAAAAAYAAADALSTVATPTASLAALALTRPNGSQEMSPSTASPAMRPAFAAGVAAVAAAPCRFAPARRWPRTAGARRQLRARTARRAGARPACAHGVEDTTGTPGQRPAARHEATRPLPRVTMQWRKGTTRAATLAWPRARGCGCSASRRSCPVRLLRPRPPRASPLPPHTRKAEAGRQRACHVPATRGAATANAKSVRPADVGSAAGRACPCGFRAVGVLGHGRGRSQWPVPGIAASAARESAATWAPPGAWRRLRCCLTRLMPQQQSPPRPRS